MAVQAPDEASAAHYYPAIYWFTLLKIPPARDFGGTTDIPKEITLETWRQRMNNVDCIGCHQLGQESHAHHSGRVRQHSNRVRRRGCGASPPVRPANG